MSRKAPHIIEVDAQRIEELLQRVESNTLRDDDMELVRQILASYRGLFQIVGDKNTTIARLRKLMFGAATETSKNILGDSKDASNQPDGDASDTGNASGNAADAESSKSHSNEADDSSEPPTGHGRYGAEDYPGAEQVDVKHPQYSPNLPKELATILANCLSHGRRNFVELHDRFPEECRHVIEAFRVIYHNDKVARDSKMSAQERLALHQTQSKPTMDNLHVWLQRQLSEKLVEPNSALGDAINYLLKRWEPLTLFLRKAGAPLDNNLCERALKKAIMHRKNSMFYKTRNGARVGDMYMSLIYTCELSGVSAFDYLNQLQLNATDVAKSPDRWMPWNYRENVQPVSDTA